MSQAGVEQLIGRMITDGSFRLAVAADADKALALSASDFRDLLAKYFGRAGELERLSHARLRARRLVRDAEGD